MSSKSQPLSHPELEYDGSELPVLIRLPDLSDPGTQQHVEPAAELAPVASAPAPDKPATELSSTPAPEPRIRVGQNEQDGRSKLLVAVLLLVVIGLTYAVIRGGGNSEEPSEDTWATPEIELPSELPSERLAVEPKSTPGELDESLNLWPSHPGADPSAMQQTELVNATLQPVRSFPQNTGQSPNVPAPVQATAQDHSPTSNWPTDLQPTNTHTQTSNTQIGFGQPHARSPVDGFPDSRPLQDDSYRTGLLRPRAGESFDQSPYGARLNGDVVIPQPRKRL